MYTSQKLEKAMEEKIVKILKEQPQKYVTFTELSARIAPRGITYYRATQNLVASGRVAQNTEGLRANA